jgi:hypothetical protein
MMETDVDGALTVSQETVVGALADAAPNKESDDAE